MIGRGVAVGIALSFPALAPAPAPERVADVGGLDLYSAFWPNLHHRLHAEARRRLNPGRGGPEPLVLDGLTPEERARLERALVYYERTLAPKDLRTGEGMVAISDALASSGPALSTGGLTSEHRAALARAAGKDPGLLWHAVQFYIVGEVVRECVAWVGEPFTPYLYSTGLFERAWRRFRAPIETHVKASVEGRIGLDEMAGRLVGDIEP